MVTRTIEMKNIIQIIALLALTAALSACDRGGFKAQNGEKNMNDDILVTATSNVNEDDVQFAAAFVIEGGIDKSELVEENRIDEAPSALAKKTNEIPLWHFYICLNKSGFVQKGEKEINFSNLAVKDYRINDLSLIYGKRLEWALNSVTLEYEGSAVLVPRSQNLVEAEYQLKISPKLQKWSAVDPEHAQLQSMYEKNLPVVFSANVSSSDLAASDWTQVANYEVDDIKYYIKGKVLSFKREGTQSQIVNECESQQAESFIKTAEDFSLGR